MTKTRAEARDLGQHALQGWRKHVADAAAPRIASRSRRVSEADVRGVIGLLFLALGIWHIVQTLKRFVQQRKGGSFGDT
jgi:hypothetical protein